MTNVGMTTSNHKASRGYAGLTLATAFLLAVPLFAQAKKEEAPLVPTGPAPKHDLSGVWMLRSPAEMRAFTNFTFTKDEPELTALGKEEYAKAKSSNGGKYTLETTNDPVLTRCAPPGTPRVYFHPYPFEFVNAGKEWLQIFEYDHTIRRMYDDGRPVPTDPDLTWGGTSVGRWENDTTFTVETVGLNDHTWLDRSGHRHSTDLKVTERFRRVDAGHLQIDFKMEDPKFLAKPWTSTFHYELRPKWELGEISCSGDYLDFSKFEK